MKKFGKIMVVVLALATMVGACFAFTACNDNKVKIGAQAGTTGELYLKGDADMNFSGFKNVKAITYDNIGQAVEAMMNGSISYVVGDIEPAKAAAANYDAKVIDIPLSSEDYAIGVNKKDAALLENINRILGEMKQNGAIQTIIDNYNDENYTPVGYPAGTVNTTNPESQLVVATNAEFQPFEYTSGDKFIGIDMEIAKAVADALNMELVIVNMDFDSVVLSVGTNNVDIAIAGLTVKESRKVSVNFSDAYYTDSYQVLIVKDGDTTFDECTTKAEIEAKLKSLK